ncbi:ATP-binding protein [Methyloglobulus sp.]|uniref:hybrid sensor histidine kinase/response regulator n=1 Tax=Methyloglobulus sp. TaxID=2518622 RepID=UPI00398A4ADE
MNSNDNNGGSDGGNAGQPDATNQSKDKRLAVRGNDMRLTESAVIDNEVAAKNRKKRVIAREDAADLCEDTIHFREEDATSREQEICKTETTQAESNNHILILQQVNARLVIATIEAQKLAEQVQTARDQMEIAKTVADKANRVKSEFLSNMSHELRTPLNAILGFAQLLEAGTPPPTATQMVRLQQIIKAGWYLLELINEILDIALIESGRLSLSREPVSLADVLLECQAMIGSQAQQRDIKLTFLPFDSTWFVYADRTRVKQVLVNLLSNAIKYNCEHGTIEVNSSANTPGLLRISIKDSGAGLPPEQLAQLFQPFNRLGQETGAEEGTGIGLVVTKQLVELMGGTIGVESTVGVGSVFWIELIRDVTPQLAAENTMSAELTSQAQGNAALHTLLYVEDNPANLLLVEQIIENHPQIRLLSAHDGNLGIALARAHLPNVILMDINLSGINGIQALKILREDPATAHIPVIALSANAMPRDIEKGLEAGFFRYLTKPIKVNELMSAIDDTLKFSEMRLINTNETGQIR